MALIRVVAIAALAIAVLSITLRARVVNVLKKAGLYEQMGSPRKLFYSDFLHYRVVGLTWKRSIAPHKTLFRWFVVVSMILDACCVYIGWWGAYGRD